MTRYPDPWERLPTDFIFDWQHQILRRIELDREAIAGKRKPTAGQLHAIELQEKLLKAIRRELRLRGEV